MLQKRSVGNFLDLFQLLCATWICIRFFWAPAPPQSSAFVAPSLDPAP